MLITIREFVQGKTGVTYSQIYNRMYLRNIQPYKIIDGKNYYQEKDLIKILNMKVRKR